jgi:Dolichyl-phosphate-mannose-protein mannosyltransferase
MNSTLSFAAGIRPWAMRISHRSSPSGCRRVRAGRSNVARASSGVLAAAALVWVVVAFVRLLRGGDAAAWIGGLAAALAPILMGLTATLNTTTFEPLAWTTVAYCLARAAILDDRRSLLWAGLAGGLAEAKYALPLWLFSLAVAMLLFPQRRLFRYRELWFGLAITFIIAIPSVIWQAAHAFPFVELVHNAGGKDITGSPIAFALRCTAPRTISRRR